MSVTARGMLLREWRGGELGVLVAALVLAVGIVSGISAFTARLQSALVQQSNRFLAADSAVRGSSAAPEHWHDYAQSLGLQSARTLQFPSMIDGGDEAMALCAVKAVQGGYPLRGQLMRSDAPFATPQSATRGPAAGEVWMDPRLFALLDVTVGDQITLGDAHLRVAAAVRSEPDQGGSFFDYGPRVLMHYDDLAATNVVQPGSRVEFRSLFAGEPAAMERLNTWLEAQLADGDYPGLSLMTVEEGQPNIAAALARAERFLLLAGSLGVILAAVAVALAARRFSERHYDYVAIMKSLGATSSRIARLYFRSLIMLGLLATVLGCALGWALQAAFFVLFAEQLPVQPGSIGLRPYLIGGGTALVCLLCFAWPPLRRLGLASPLRVLRRDIPLQARRSVTDYLIGLAAMTALMGWYSRDPLLTLAVLGGLGAAIVLGLLLALLLLRGGRAVGMSAGSIWRLALAGLQRRGATNALQVVMFAIAIMLLLMLLLVRTSLIDRWQMQLPAETPNHFMINIAADEVAAIDAELQRHAVPAEPFFPTVRARLMTVSGQALPASADASVDRRQREANLTWSAEVPASNTVIRGQWWQGVPEAPLVSVEQEYAERLRLSVGDTLEFLVGAQPLRATVANIRQLQWESMRPNFFLVFSPGALEDYPATYMSAFYLPPEDKPYLNQLVRQFPTATVIEMDVVIAQVRAIITQVSRAIELVLGIILAAGALVMIAGVQASVDARMREGAILRALGARKSLILGGLCIEFLALGMCAGVLAVVGAEVAVWVLQTQAMDMVYHPSPWMWPLGLAGSALLIALVGVWSCRRVVSSAPVAVLRAL